MPEFLARDNSKFRTGPYFNLGEPQLRVEPWDFTNMDEHQFEYSVPGTVY